MARATILVASYHDARISRHGRFRYGRSGSTHCTNNYRSHY
jgi:hypothetical protein